MSGSDGIGDDDFEDGSEPPTFSQIGLVGAIWEYMAKCGVECNIRQQNAAIRAANIVVEELNQPHRPATPGMGQSAWLYCDETGQSSKYLCNALNNPHHVNEVCHPHDADDFGRCVKMLYAIPSLRERLGVMAEAKHGPVWNAIAARWGELESMWLAKEYGPLTASLQEILESREKQ